MRFTGLIPGQLKLQVVEISLRRANKLNCLTFLPTFEDEIFDEV